MSENFKTAPAEAEKMIRKLIENWMEEKGITRYQLQQLTKINRSTIGRWLRGETSMSFNNFLKICDALDIRPYLVKSEDDDT